MTAPFPAGQQVDPDPDTVALDADTVALLGGSPRRVMRLSAAGRTAWDELRDGPVRSAAAGVLARRLTDAGLAHPRAGRLRAPLDVTVVIPVRDRAAPLDRCLASLGDQPVVVVDDGSADGAAVAAIARRHGARLVRHGHSLGPAAARNSGLTGVTSELVAFLDSDCVPPAAWITALAGHFADPLVAAVAPRIVTADPQAPTYLAAHSVLDLGPRAARVRPGSRVGFVPTAALLVRRSALESVAGDGAFDARLRYGEDVDLVWRLDAAGWRVRYDPSVEVVHAEPASWRDRALRRFRYGTSAAPLSRRHPEALAPLVLAPWPAAVVAGLLLRRPVVTVAAAAAGVVATRRAVAGSGLSGLSATRLSGAAVGHTWAGVGRYLTQLGAPLAVAALVARRGRLALAALVMAPPLWEGVTSRASAGPLRYAAGRIADDIAYGAGLASGAVRHRTVRPLLPVVVPSRRQSRGAR